MKTILLSSSLNTVFFPHNLSSPFSLSSILQSTTSNVKFMVYEYFFSLYWIFDKNSSDNLCVFNLPQSWISNQQQEFLHQQTVYNVHGFMIFLSLLVLFLSFLNFCLEDYTSSIVQLNKMMIHVYNMDLLHILSSDLFSLFKSKQKRQFFLSLVWFTVRKTVTNWFSKHISFLLDLILFGLFDFHLVVWWFWWWWDEERDDNGTITSIVW